MRTIERSSAFKRDFKKVALAPRYRKELNGLMTDVLACLVQDLPLDENFSDHGLTGNWAG